MFDNPLMVHHGMFWKKDLYFLTKLIVESSFGLFLAAGLWRLRATSASLHLRQHSILLYAQDPLRLNALGIGSFAPLHVISFFITETLGIIAAVKESWALEKWKERHW